MDDDIALDISDELKKSNELRKHQNTLLSYIGDKLNDIYGGMP